MVYLIIFTKIKTFEFYPKLYLQIFPNSLKSWGIGIFKVLLLSYLFYQIVGTVRHSMCVGVRHSTCVGVRHNMCERVRHSMCAGVREPIYC